RIQADDQRRRFSGSDSNRRGRQCLAEALPFARRGNDDHGRSNLLKRSPELRAGYVSMIIFARVFSNLIQQAFLSISAKLPYAPIAETIDSNLELLFGSYPIHGIVRIST